MNFQTVVVALADCLYCDEFDIKGWHWMKKFPPKISCTLSVNEVVSTLIMRQFILIVITLKSVTFNSGSKD